MRNACAILLSVYLLTVNCVWGSRSETHPNRLYSPSFAEPVFHKDSLSDWKKATFGAAKSDTVRWMGRCLLSTVVNNKPALAAHFSLQHLFSLPARSKELRIRLTGMFDYPNGITSPVFLVVRQYVRGLLSAKDSLNLLRTNSLHAWERVCLLPDNCSDLDISIESQGIALYLLDSMVIHVDGVDAADLEFDKAKKPTLSEMADLKRNRTNGLHFYKQPRILGVGESVHGSKQLNSEQLRLIRQLIRENRLDVLLIECSQPVGDRLNRYVTGLSDSIGGVSDLGLYANRAFVDLLRFMRRFNQNRKENPVQLGGYDVTFADWPNGLPNSSLRDSMMFVHVRDVVERIGPDKRVVVQGHLGHLVKTADYGKPEFTPPLGYYLDRTFGKEFKVLGLFVGNGERLCKVYKPSVGMVMDVVPLAIPLENSLEQLCAWTGPASFYLSGWQGKSWMERVYRCRRGGLTQADAEFYPFNFGDMDAVYFTKKSTALVQFQDHF